MHILFFQFLLNFFQLEIILCSVIQSGDTIRKRMILHKKINRKRRRVDKRRSCLLTNRLEVLFAYITFAKSSFEQKQKLLPTAFL